MHRTMTIAYRCLKLLVYALGQRKIAVWQQLALRIGLGQR